MPRAVKPEPIRSSEEDSGAVVPVRDRVSPIAGPPNTPVVAFLNLIVTKLLNVPSSLSLTPGNKARTEEETVQIVIGPLTCQVLP